MSHPAPSGGSSSHASSHKKASERIKKFSEGMAEGPLEPFTGVIRGLFGLEGGGGSRGSGEHHGH